MSEYTQITDFSAKDDLPTSDPEKLILGADIDGEFSAISTAITSKLNNNAADVITVADNSNEALTITQTGNGGGVLIDDTGTGIALHVTNATAQAAVDPVLVVGDSGGSVQATNFADGILVDSQKYGLALKRHNDTDSAVGVINVRSRGTSGAETAVGDNDNLGTFSAMGRHGTGYTTAGYLAFRVDEAQRSLSGTNIPTEFFLVLNDGTTYNTPLQILPSATAGYSHTTINGSATINGQTAASGLTINSNGDAYTAVTAIANNDTCTAQLANNSYTFVGSGGSFVQTGVSTTHAATFNSEAAAFGAILTYSQDDGTVMRLSYSNQYTAYGTGGEIINYGASATSSDYSFRAKNSGGSDILGARNDGQIYTGTLSKSPYNNTTASAANMFVSSGGTLFRSTSSARFKQNVQPLADEWADKILDLEPVFYESTAAGDAANPDWTYYGFIAEDVAAVDGRYVHFDTGEREEEAAVLDPETKEVVRPARPPRGRKPQAEWIPDGVQYERMVVPLINVVKRQRDRIEALEAQLAALADRVTALEG